MAKSAVLALLLTISGALLLSAAAEKKVLVLYGASNIKDTHSQFIQGLEDQGLKVDLKSVKDSGLKLKDYDTWLYDALVLLAPKATSRWHAAATDHGDPWQLTQLSQQPLCGILVDYTAHMSVDDLSLFGDAHVILHSSRAADPGLYPALLDPG